MLHTAYTLLDANSHRAQAKSMNPVTLDKAEDVDTITSHLLGLVICARRSLICQAHDIYDFISSGFMSRLCIASLKKEQVTVGTWQL